MRDVHVFNATFCVKFVKPFIFKSMQRVKTGLLNKSNSADAYIRRMVSPRCHGALPTAAIRPFGRCHQSYLLCSKHLGALTISSKIYLLSGQHTVDCKSPHKTLVWTSQILFKQGSHILAWVCETVGTITDLLHFSWQPQSAQCL